jgi:hypothetical protein
MLLTPELNLLAKLVKDFIILDGTCGRRPDLGRRRSGRQSANNTLSEVTSFYNAGSSYGVK